MQVRFAKIAVAALLACVLAVPAFAARGTADFTRFVVIGDSYGAGVQSGSLNDRHQPYSWDAILARQAGLQICAANAAATDNCFAIPFVSYPGIPADMALTGAGPVTLPGQGAPYMTGFGRPYNNLSIPGATVGDVMTLTGAEAHPTRTPELYAPFILRGLGTEVDQALAQHPTFIAVWIGGNDFLGAVSGGKPSLLTPVDTFKTQYNAMLDKLIAGAPSAGMVVGTLPETFAAPPLTNQLPPVVFGSDLKPVNIPGIGQVPLVADLGGGNYGPLPAGSIVLLSAIPKIQTGYGIPSALGAFPPFNAMPNVGKPLADADVITPTEKAAFVTAITAYNQAIIQAAQARDIPVADVKGMFDRFAASTAATPMMIGPFAVTNVWPTGGLFSFDGVHLSDIGYMLMADQYIKAINGGYSTRIPLAGLWQLLQNNDPATKAAMPSIFVPEEVAAQMIWVFQPLPQPDKPAPTSRRRASH